MFLLKLHIIQGEFGPEKAERSCLRLFPTQSCHARCWPVVCSSTPGAFEYCTGLGWMSPRPFCRCACQNGTEFRWTTCCARAPEMGAACCTRGQHAAPKPIKALVRRTIHEGRGQSFQKWEKERSRPRGVEREVVKGMMSRSGVSNGGGSVAWRITDDIGRRFSMRTPDNPPPVHLQRISILIPGQHLFRQ